MFRGERPLMVSLLFCVDQVKPLKLSCNSIEITC